MKPSRIFYIVAGACGAWAASVGELPGASGPAVIACFAVAVFGSIIDQNGY